MVGWARVLLARFQASLVGRLLKKFGEDQAPNQAVLVAWNALYSMFPIILVILGVVGVVLNAIGFKASIVESDLVQMFPDAQTAKDFSQALNGVKHQTGVFFIVGFLGLVWSGTNLFGTMEYAFDVLFHAPRRGFVRMRLMAVGMIAIFTVLTVIAIGTASVLPLVRAIPGLPRFLVEGPAAVLLQAAIGIVDGVLLFGSMYLVVPNRRQRPRAVWPGALLAGVLFEALTLAFPLYLSFNKGLDQYGKTFGLMFILMTFFYFVGLITMLGAELNALLYPVPVERTETAERADPIPPPPSARRPPSRKGSAQDAAPESGPRPRRPSGVKRAALGVVGVAVGLFAATRHARRPPLR